MSQKQVVVVIGMHRSGTSAITKGLEALGISLSEEVLGAKEDNQKGFWEDIKVLEINESLLALQESSWDDNRLGLAPLVESVEYKALFAEAVALVEERVVQREVWGVKDPRTSVLESFWTHVFETAGVEAKYLVCMRNPLDVAKSLTSRNQMDRYYGLSLWVKYTVSALKFAQNNPCALVHFEDIMSETSASMESVAKVLGLDVDQALLEQFAEGFLDRSLVHSESPLSLLEKDPQLSPALVNLYRYTLSLVDKPLEDIDVAFLEQQQEAFFEHYADYFALLEDKLALDKEVVAQADELYLRGQALHERDISILATNQRLEEQVQKINQHEEQIGQLKCQVCKLNAENEQLAEQAGALAGIQESYNQLIASKSWVITKPMRGIRRLITKPGQYSPHYMSRLKGAIKKTPLLPLARKLQLKYHALKHKCQAAPHSSQNLHSIQSVSDKRANVLFSDAHVKTAAFRLGDAQPEVAVTVVTYNNGRWLPTFSQSLLAQQYPCHKMHLHFVDNGSTDDTVEKLNAFKSEHQEAFASVSVHQRPNLGFGAGHDYAITQSDTEFVLVTNIDLEFSPQAISNVVNFAVDDSEEVASWELRQKPYEHPKYYDPVTLEAAWSSHACILIRRSAYDAVGGYEHRIFMYGEDVELSYRFRNAGYILRYVPAAYVHHYTYDEVNQVKPIQFTGSTVANALLRFRYGNNVDKVSALALQAALMVRGGSFPDSRKLLLGNVNKLFKDGRHFLGTQRREGVYFPFRGFDYEMTRDGAFYTLNPENQQRELPKVTIVTRTYRGREFWLKECIASVINQTYPNIEHVIVEDGGETMKPLVEEAKAAYGENYTVRFAGFDKKGRSHTGNQGLEMASGEYCLFLDDDDLIFPDHVEVLVDEMLADPKLGAAYSLAWDVHTDVDRSKEVPTYKEHHFETLPVFHQEFDVETMLRHNYIPIQAILFKKSLYTELGGFDETMEHLEDWNLWTKYALNSTFKFVPKTTSLFRTPSNEQERLRRALLLDSAFQSAMEKQQELIQQAEQSKLAQEEN
ncbi:glycosyltransferase [Photobacterium sp. BZF1]|uniref:glycosyltransferase n=1 Tax=Photobacterium sp. BZF1 TaxID=1904457 RepID=UPI001653E5C3|nr:glycosyltransferase [Photobacterium sp. BZF1]MBC7005806.1 glycosyltransferase [Photobacterium sp. BZF1]